MAEKHLAIKYNNRLIGTLSYLVQNGEYLGTVWILDKGEEYKIGEVEAYSLDRLKYLASAKIRNY